MPYKSSFFAIAIGILLIGCDSGSPVDPIDDPSGTPPGEQQVPIAELLSSAIILKKNPHGIAPLTAMVTLSTTVPTHVAVEVLGDEPAIHEFKDLATDHSLPVLGLYPGVENTVVIRLTIPDSVYAADTLRFATPALPSFFPTVDIVTADQNQMELGWTMSALSIGEAGVFRPYPIMFDSNGDIRWYLDLSFINNPTVTAERLANGNILAGDARLLYEYDMLGTEVNRWDLTPYRIHHDVVEKPDGNLIIAVDKDGLETIEDHMIEIDRTSGAVITEWDLREVLDIDRFEYQLNERDWLHVNAVVYDPADDALIISGRNQGVIKVTRNNELVWIIAPHVGWGQAGLDGDGHETSDFLLTAVNTNGTPYSDAVQLGDEEPDDFGWPWGQHAPVFLPNGNLFLFDNGNNRLFSQNGPFYSRGTEYTIHESAMTIEQVWQYGKERGEEFYSFIISDVDYLPTTGNRLIMPGLANFSFSDPSGSYALVTELANGSTQVVFEAKISFKNLLSTGTGFGQFDIVYRSQRLPLYPDEPLGNALWASGFGS